MFHFLLNYYYIHFLSNFTVFWSKVFLSLLSHTEKSRKVFVSFAVSLSVYLSLSVSLSVNLSLSVSLSDYFLLFIFLSLSVFSIHKPRSFQNRKFFDVFSSGNEAKSKIKTFAFHEKKLCRWRFRFFLFWNCFLNLSEKSVKSFPRRNY